MKQDNDYEIDSDKLEETWLLVSWVGSIPEESFDVVNCSDVAFDEIFTPKCLKLSSLVMVKCGRTKSPAVVRQISDSVSVLRREIVKLQAELRKENIDPVSENKHKRAKYDKETNGRDQDNCNQNDALAQAEKMIRQLTQENQKLKAELYESNKIINTICKDLKGVVNNVQKKMQDKTSNESHNLSDVSDSPNNSITCPVQELQQKVLIGSGRTEVPRQIYAQVNWLSYAAATRKLLMAVFPRDVLATHSLTGKPSPAFLQADMPSKDRLDPVKVADIIEIVTYKCGVSDNMVRSAITTKCADENKMYKKRMEKMKRVSF